MARKPTYQELEQRIRELEEKCAKTGLVEETRTRVSGIEVAWYPAQGICTFGNLPVAMMWVDTTLAGLMSGVQSMVGTGRFGLALQSEGRKSVEADWQVISTFPHFREGFKAIANIASVAGWGYWELLSLDEEQKECRFRVRDSWEGRYQKALGVSWGSAMLAGKMAGYCSKLFGANCWADQVAFIAKGDDCDEFVVRPSSRSLEKEIESLLASDEATRADMAVALQKLEKEISERKQAEDALRMSEEQLSKAVDMSHLGHWEYDVVNDLFTFNDHFYKIFRTTAKPVGGYTMSSAEYARRFVYPDDISVVGDEIRKTIEAKDPSLGRQLEHRMLYGDGTVGYIAVRFFIVKDSEGRTVKTYGVNQDITERKRAEEALRESQERFKDLADMLPQGVFETDREGVLTYANQCAYDMFGYSREDFEKGLNIMQTLIPQDRERASQVIQKILAGASAGNGHEYRVQRRDGSSFAVALYSSPIIRRDRTVGLRGIIVDITERKRAEEEREKLQSQLNQAQKMESVGRLAGGVAHDFNNMLGAIVGNAELAGMKINPADPVHHELREIMKAAQRSADLVRQLLAFARKQTVSPRVLDLNDTVSGMLKMLRRLIGEDIDLAWLPGHDLCPVKIDPSQIDQILANLAVNARDAIAGVGKVTFETNNTTFDEAYCADHPGSAPGRYVLLAVSDDGVGMSGEVLEHLFEPFFTTKEVGKGTGLGLSTIYGIVKQNEGYINVYSEPGRGTTFKIYLPSFEAEPAEAPQESKLEIPKGGTEIVLIVEDDAAILKIARAMLEALGYTVLSASTPGEAIRLAEEYGRDIQLLLTDVVMPRMNGKELAEEIKLIHPDLKCLFMSGYTANVIAHHGVLEEGVNFINKPFSTKELASAVRKTLDQI